MKTKIVKYLFAASILFFFNYILIAVLGCVSEICGAGNDYFCGPFCWISLSIYGLTTIYFVGWIWTNERKKKADTTAV